MEKNISLDRKSMPVFVFWAQGLDQAPFVVKRNISRLQKIFGSRLHILDESCLKYYATLPKISNISRWAHKADMLRTELLLRYGGTWIDSTILVKQDFLNIINENSAILPIYYPEQRSMGNWLLSVDSTYNYTYCLMYSALNMYLDLYGDFNEYFMFHTFWRILAHIDDNARSFWNNCLKIDANKATVLGGSESKLLQVLSYEDFVKIFNDSPIHKLSYKYDETMVTLDSNIARLMRMN